MKAGLKNIAAITLCVIIGLLSCMAGAPRFENENTYTKTVETLDMVKGNAALLTTSTAAAATVAAAVPGDVTTPLANKIVDIAGYTVIVYVAIVAEKYLLLTVGGFTFRYVIPVVCVIMALYFLMRALGHEIKGLGALKNIALKVASVFLILWLVVPASAYVQQNIYDNYNTSREKRLEELNEKYLSDDAAEILKGKTVKEEKRSILDKISGKINKAKEVLKNGSKAAVEYLKTYLDLVLEWAAVLIAITVVIPIAMAFIALFVVKQIFNLNYSVNPLDYAARLKLSKLTEGQKKQNEEK